MDIERSDNSAESNIEVVDEPSNTDANIKSTENVKKTRNTRLPIARVRHIMKMDPECQLISQDAALMVTKATEIFLQNLARQVVKYTLQNKRKTILKRDLEAAVETNSNLCFLDGTMD